MFESFAWDLCGFPKIDVTLKHYLINKPSNFGYYPKTLIIFRKNYNSLRMNSH